MIMKRLFRALAYFHYFGQKVVLNAKILQIQLLIKHDFIGARQSFLHFTHHPVIPVSDLYFTFCSTLNILSEKNIKVTVNELFNSFGKWN